MEHLTSRTELSLEKIEQSLRSSFPESTIFYRKNLTGRYLIINESNFIGVGIWIKNDTIKMEEVIPSIKLTFLLGSGLPIILSIMKNKKTWKHFKTSIQNHIIANF